MYLRKVHLIDNTPSDWDAHWRTCSRCGARYHASDGGCECEEKVEKEMTTRKFYRRIFHIEVLSEEHIPDDCDLDGIDANISAGPWSGKVTCDDEVEMDGAETAKRLIEQGSEPGFFDLTEDGEDAED